MKSDDNKQNILKIVGLAVGLPSSILGVFIIIYILVEKNIITATLGLVIILIVITYTFYLMIRYALKKQD